MAPQVVRILIVFGSVICLFLAIRSQAKPDGFTGDGFHRTQAPAEIAKAPIHHGGMKACSDCHGDKIDSTPHVKKGVHCESCHGPAEKHVQDTENVKPFVPSEREDCTRCHAAIVSRPSWFPQIDPKTHNPGSKCIGCHTIHPAEGDAK